MKLTSFYDWDVHGLLTLCSFLTLQGQSIKVFNHTENTLRITSILIDLSFLVAYKQSSASKRVSEKINECYRYVDHKTECWSNQNSIQFKMRSILIINTANLTHCVEKWTWSLQCHCDHCIQHKTEFHLVLLVWIWCWSVLYFLCLCFQTAYKRNSGTGVFVF